MTPEEDYRCRSDDLQRVMGGGGVGVSEYQQLKMTRTVNSQGEAEEEYDFNTEVVLKLKDPIWKEKYCPRKPRFFNRVHTVSEGVDTVLINKRVSNLVHNMTLKLTQRQ